MLGWSFVQPLNRAHDFVANGDDAVVGLGIVEVASKTGRHITSSIEVKTGGLGCERVLGQSKRRQGLE